MALRKYEKLGNFRMEEILEEFRLKNIVSDDAQLSPLKYNSNIAE